ncbi:MAG: diguanylate cyclase [Lachnospiraceae bacterium]|nr:diguanylate cyclase [Lachnospiraceae bacterium]
MLQFWGRGSAFHSDNNSAFYVDGSNLLLLDFPMSSFHKMRKAAADGITSNENSSNGISSGAISSIKHIYVLVTHTHSDHIGGIPMLIHYAYYVWDALPVTVVAPSKKVAKDLHFLISHLEGCDENAYEIITADELSKWDAKAIPTTHTEELDGRCFGYHLMIGDKSVVYTGDTNTLKPFEPYLKKGVYFYTEIAAIASPVHLSAEQELEKMLALAGDGVHVFLMHLDREDEIEDMIKGTGIQLAPLAKSFLGNDVGEGSEQGQQDPLQEKGAVSDMNSQQLLTDIFSVSHELYRDMSQAGETDHMKIFTHLTELGRILTESDRASFWKWDKGTHTLWTMTATGTGKITIPDTTGLVGKALSEGEVIVTNDPYNNPYFNADVDKKTGYVTKSILVMPVANVKGEYIGAYQVINKLGGDGTYDEQEDCRKLSLAAMICGLALESDVFLEESHTDKLTGLRNRMGFFHDFDKKYRSYIENPDADLALFICDIDKFKRVNDTYGHNIGDEVLKHVASILRDHRPEDGDVYRWGGEEFIMIMPGQRMDFGAAKAEEIRAFIEAHDCVTDTVTVHHTMSFGVAEFDSAKSIEDNIKVADDKLYRAKEEGRNRVIV